MKEYHGSTICRKLLPLHYKIEWEDMSGKTHTDFFVGQTSGKWNMDVSYIHRWNNPQEGLRKFLTYCPVHNLKITAWEE
jgi:hypothetical protein